MSPTRKHTDHNITIIFSSNPTVFNNHFCLSSKQNPIKDLIISSPQPHPGSGNDFVQCVTTQVLPVNPLRESSQFWHHRVQHWFLIILSLVFFFMVMFYKEQDLIWGTQCENIMYKIYIHLLPFLAVVFIYISCFMLGQCCAFPG